MSFDSLIVVAVKHELLKLLAQRPMSVDELFTFASIETVEQPEPRSDLVLDDASM